MRIFVRSFIVLLLYSALSSAQAAPCRSGSAAARGSQVSYENDKRAAEQTARSERSASDTLGKCIGGITAVMTAPQFPSISDIFNQIKDKVCRVASDQIYDAMSDLNRPINNVMHDINNQTSNIDNQMINVPHISGPALQQTSAGSSQSSAFWSHIWK